MNLGNWKKITRESYDKNAKDYELFTKSWLGKGKKWIEEFSFQFKKGSSVLDIGCGTGRDALFMTKKGLKVTGIDFSEEHLNIAKKKAAPAKFILMDFEDIKFTKNSFDGVWAMASLLHVPKKRLLPVLKRIHSILKKNGLFFSCFRIGEGEKFTEEKRGNAMLKRFYAYYAKEELENLWRKAGFHKIWQELDVVQTGKWVGIFARK